MSWSVHSALKPSEETSVTHNTHCANLRPWYPSYKYMHWCQIMNQSGLLHAHCAQLHEAKAPLYQTVKKPALPLNWTQASVSSPEHLKPYPKDDNGSLQNNYNK